MWLITRWKWPLASWLWENKGRRVGEKKTKGNVWNDELAGGVLCSPLCFCGHGKCWWCKTKQPHKGDGRSRMFCVIYCFRFRKKHKTYTSSKILLLGGRRFMFFVAVVMTWTLINPVPIAQMFVRLIFIIFARLCILYNVPILLFSNWIIKHAHWCPAVFLALVNDDTAYAGNTSRCQRHYDVMP